MTILNLDTKLVVNKDLMQAPNLCDRFKDAELDTIGHICWRGYDRDLQSRSRWESRMNAGMDLALQIQKAKSFPWPDSANVVFPLVTIAALQFSARTYTNIIQGTDIVRYQVIDEDPNGLLQKRADRISKHMSWQCLEEDKAWEEEHDRLLINLGIVGTNFVKSSYNAKLGCITSELITARDFVLDYYAKSVESCTRKTQRIMLYRNEIYERSVRGTFRDVVDENWFKTPPALVASEMTRSDERTGMSPPVNEDDQAFETLEQHRFFDFDKDGYAEPYIVTIEKNSHKVLRIAARFDTEEQIERTSKGKIICIRPMEYFTKYSFIPSPDGGIYDIGFGILLGPLNEAVNSGINQLLDSGTMQNCMGGFLGRGAKIRGGVYTMAPWEWKRVDSSGDDLRKNLVPYPDRQPSNVMFSLLGLLINYTDRAAGTTDPMVGENPGQNTPAETSRSMVEQGSQIYNVVFKRVWRSMKQEFKKRHLLNGMFLSGTKKFGTGGSRVRKEDYASDPDQVVPSADPNVTSSGMRFMQAQAVRQASLQVPGYDPVAVEKNFLQALRVNEIDKLYPGPDKVPPAPNPLVQREEMKLRAKAMEIQHDKFKFLLQMMEDRRVNTAKIAELQAKAAQIIASIGVERASAEIQAFQAAISALESFNTMLNERIQSMQGEETNADGEGVPGVADQSGNAGGNAGLPGLAGPVEGAVGNGGLQQ